MKKYMLWLLGVIIWNFGYPGALPIYDGGMAIILKQVFNLPYFNSLSYTHLTLPTILLV